TALVVLRHARQRQRPCDGTNPVRHVLPDDGGREPSSDGGGPPAFGPQDGPPQCHVRGRPRGGPRSDRPTRHPRDRREDRPLVRGRDPQGREDRLHVQRSSRRIPPTVASRRRGIAIGSIGGLDRLIFNRPTEYYSPSILPILL